MFLVLRFFLVIIVRFVIAAGPIIVDIVFTIVTGLHQVIYRAGEGPALADDPIVHLQLRLLDPAAGLLLSHGAERHEAITALTAIPAGTQVGICLLDAPAFVPVGCGVVLCVAPQQFDGLKSGPIISTVQKQKNRRVKVWMCGTWYAP